MDYLFTIFHRLNTGGTRLNNQEIRYTLQGVSNSFRALWKTLQSWIIIICTRVGHPFFSKERSVLCGLLRSL